MKTRCPACATSFRVGPEQLKARAGKVRCGQCGSVFNALDTLLDELVVVTAPASSAGEAAPSTATTPQASPLATIPADQPEPAHDFAATDEAPPLAAAGEETQDGAPEPTPLHAAEPECAADTAADLLIVTPAAGAPASDGDAEYPAMIAADSRPAHDGDTGADGIEREEPHAGPAQADSGEASSTIEPAAGMAAALEAAPEPEAVPPADSTPATATDATADTAPLPPSAAATAIAPPAVAIAADGGVLPRQMTEVPGYSKWSEGAIANTAAAVEVAQPGAPQTTFVVVAGLLALLLAGQTVFHFRSEIAASAPSLQRALITYADLFGAGLPPLRRAEMISIEGSDLQADPARRGQLLLLATLANRAPYAQALPLLELTLTDTHDQAVARKVFTPEQYLPDAAAAAAPFAPRSEIALRLAVETRDIAAAGYRLYVFYP